MGPYSSKSISNCKRRASLVVNISASNGLFTKEEIRKNLIKTYSFKNLVTYAYCSVGHGEASNDMIWDGHCLVYSNGNILKEKNHLLIKISKPQSRFGFGFKYKKKI